MILSFKEAIGAPCRSESEGLQWRSKGHFRCGSPSPPATLVVGKLHAFSANLSLQNLILLFAELDDGLPVAVEPASEGDQHESPG